MVQPRCMVVVLCLATVTAYFIVGEPICLRMPLTAESDLHGPVKNNACRPMQWTYQVPCY